MIHVRVPLESEMYGIPPNVDWSFLVESRLGQLCAGENEIILRFDERISVTIESRCVVRRDGVELIDSDSSIEVARCLLSSIGDSVSECRPISSTALAIRFTKGTELLIHDDSDHYESFQVRNGETLHVI